MPALRPSQSLTQNGPTSRTDHVVTRAVELHVASVRQLLCDAKFWLFAVVLLQLFRALFVLLFRQQLSGSNRINDLVAAFRAGFRFDAQTAAWFVVPGFLMSCACAFRLPQQVAARVRHVCLWGFVVASVAIGVVDLGYFQEYHDQFNHYAFGVVYDDFSAVLMTIWKQYPVIWELLGICATIRVLTLLSSRWLCRDLLREDQLAWLVRSRLRRAAALVVSIGFLACALRGSISSRPVQLKDAAVTRDHALNKMVLNPFSAARYAVVNQWRLAANSGLESYLPDRNVLGAAKSLADDHEPVTTVDDAFHRIAKGPKGLRPRHVFVIQMESYDAWPTLERYRSLGLCERLMDLGRRGIFSRKFLSASSGTMTTSASLITGLPDAGVITNYQPSARKPFATSINPILQRLDLRTRIFQCGYSSWQRSGDFYFEQGFQEVYSAANITQRFSGNEWGVDDQELFNFVLRAVDPEVPSFNFIATVSYHPPFSVDVYRRGFPLKEVPEELKSVYRADPDYLRILGHLWYADQMLGEFVEAAEKKYPNSLFVITGDHTSRKFLNGQPTLYERSAVPFVMYGPDVLKDVPVPTELVGSHQDIMPTIFELLAPKGFVYHATGRDLLDPNRPPFGFGRDEIIGPDFIASRFADGELEPLSDAKLPSAPTNLPKLKAEYKSLLGLAWWRICRGPEFSDTNHTAALVRPSSLKTSPH